jgi:hypothetical protein
MMPFMGESSSVAGLRSRLMPVEPEQDEFVPFRDVDTALKECPFKDFVGCRGAATKFHHSAI